MEPSKNKKLYLFVFIIILVPLWLTYYAWQLAEANVYRFTNAKFEALAQESEKALLHRINSYQQALLGGKGFFVNSANVNRYTWRSYVSSVDIVHNFPGINGIGIIYDIAGTDVIDYELQEQAKGLFDFEVHPRENFDHNFIIQFIEPININRAAVGLNIGFEENRRNAAIKARDSGQPAITKRILLVQDAEKTPGFLLLLPVYKKGWKTDTVEERKLAFKSWIYAPFIGKNFLRHLTDSQGQTLQLVVYDGKKEDANTLIYNSHDALTQNPPSRFVIKKQVRIMQEDWTLVWSSTPEFEALEVSYEPVLILVVGIMFTLLFSTFILMSFIRGGHEKSLGWRNYLVSSGGLVMALFVVFFLREELIKNEFRNVQNKTLDATSNLQKNIEKAFENRIFSLRRMAERWNVRGRTPHQEWLLDARAHVNEQVGLRAIEWVDNSYHVRWVEPIKSNERVIGLNILFNEERKRVLSEAINNKYSFITPPLKLVQGYMALLSYDPLFNQGEFDGFIVGVFDIYELMTEVLGSSEYQNYQVKLFYEDREIFSVGEDEAEQQYDRLTTVTLINQKFTLSVTPKQSFIDANSSLLPHFVMVGGAIIALLVGVLIHLSQRAQQKTNLLEEKDILLDIFVSNTPAAVAMFDNKLRYLAASERWYFDYQLGNQDIIGKHHYDIFPEIPQHHPEWIEVHNRVLNGEVINVEEEMFERHDGSVEWLRYRLHPWTDNTGHIGGMIMFTENITTRKQMDLMKDEFISTVNHELRTPLTSIQGSLGLLIKKTEGVLDDKSKRLLALSYDNCERLTLLVNDILDIEKIAAGKMTYHIESVVIEPLIENIIEQNQSYAERYKVNFISYISTQAATFSVDVQRFNQALTNLLSNAAKFSPEGGDVLIQARIQTDNTVHISVEDKGVGIPESFKSKIFGKFEQADSSSTRAKGGTGLGLNITKVIIEDLGGNIGFTSAEGKGSTFYIILPID